MVIDKRTWDYKYKPKTYDELIFPNRDIKTKIMKIRDDKMIAGNLLFVGVAGSGKTSTADVIIRSFISGIHDLFSFDNYKKDTLDEFEMWLHSAGNSTKRIAKMEEFERNPNTMPNGSILRMKNGLLENYQDKVSCIATSNDIRGFEEAIKRRFVILDYNVKLDEFNISEIGSRLEFILNEEKIEYDEESLIEHISDYDMFTPAQIIKDMEQKCYSGKLDNSISLKKTLKTNTIAITDTFKKIMIDLSKLSKLDLIRIYKGKMELPRNIRHLQESVTSVDVNYNEVYTKLTEIQNLPLPVYMTITDYHELDREKIYHDQHFINLIFKLIKIYSQLQENVKTKS